MDPPVLSPALSVVVPTYNRRDGLERLLLALAEQTFPADQFEVVVVNDGSTDGTAALLQGIKTPYRLHPLDQKNAGPAAARNLGVKQADGRIIVFLDDDVVPAPELLAAHATAQDGVDDLIVVGPMSPPTDWPRSVWVRWEERQLLKQYDAMATGRYPCTPRQFYTGNASVSRSLFEAAGGFDHRFKRAEDVELAFRMWSLGGRFLFEPAADVLHYAARSFSAWTKTPYQYGRYDVVMGREKGINTFQLACAEFERRNVWSQRLTRGSVGKPWRRPVAATLAAAAIVADWLRQDEIASFALSGIFNLQYWQGASDELGGPRAVWSAVEQPELAAALVRRG
jgi:GT2 family glycosyltransferase